MPRDPKKDKYGVIDQCTMPNYLPPRLMLFISIAGSVVADDVGHQASLLHQDHREP